MTKKTLILAAVFLVGVALDQASKIWVYTNLRPRIDEVVVIPHLFSLVHAQNPGAVAGFLPGQYWLFLLFTGVAVVVIGDMWRKLPANETYMSVALGLILSGAIGNAIDRIHKGTVTDFLRVYTDWPPVAGFLERHWPHTAEWPTFNVADSALVVGVALFLLHQALFESKKEPAPAAPADANPS